MPWAISNFALTLMPPAAAVILTLLRTCQGLGVGGEWGGSVLMSMEWGSAKRKGFLASWPQFGVPVGLLISTIVVAASSAATGSNFLVWGWRIPFLRSIVLVGIGLYTAPFYYENDYNR